MSTEVKETTEQNVHTFGCTDCGADLKYKPGTTSLTCEYCGAANEIPVIDDSDIEELDFHKYLEDKSDSEDKMEVSIVKCDTCGAESTLEPNITAAACPYCSSPLVVANIHSETVIQPKSLLPFKINKDEAIAEFRAWVKKLWFAPNALKKAALTLETFKGVYIPFWTYDSNTRTKYTGQRGEYYYVTVKDSKGNSRRERRTRWYSASGTVTCNFDDILVPATKSLNEKNLNDLEPWDMENLTPFEPSYLSGFTAEKYQVNLEQGFDIAKGKMESKIDSKIRGDIGGDTQRIHSKNTSYSDITFKHILLPVYVSAYKFKEKLYRFMVNARTGEVQGERPWSIGKIALAIVGGLAVIAAIYYIYQYANQPA